MAYTNLKNSSNRFAIIRCMISSLFIIYIKLMKDKL